MCMLACVFVFSLREREAIVSAMHVHVYLSLCVVFCVNMRAHDI